MDASGVESAGGLATASDSAENGDAIPAVPVDTDLPESLTVDEHVRLLLQKDPGILVRECRAHVHGRLMKMGVTDLPLYSELKLKLRDQRRALGITKMPSSPKKLKSKKKGSKRGSGSVSGYGSGSGSGKSKHGKKRKDSEKSKKRKRLSLLQGQQKYWKVLEQMMQDDPSWAFPDLLATLKSAFSSSLGGGLPRNFPSDEQIRSHYKNYRRPKRVRSPSPRKPKRSPPSSEPVNIYVKELRNVIAQAPTEELCLHPVREKLLAHFSFGTTEELPKDFPTNAMISRRINYAKKKREKLHPGAFPLSAPSSQNSVYSMYIRELVEHQPRIKFAVVKAKLLEKFTLPDGSLPKDFPTTSGLSSRTAYTRRQFKAEKKLEFFKFVQEYKSQNKEVDLDSIVELLKQPFKGYQTRDFLQEPDINDVLALFRDRVPTNPPNAPTVKAEASLEQATVTVTATATDSAAGGEVKKTEAAEKERTEPDHVPAAINPVVDEKEEEQQQSTSEPADAEQNGSALLNEVEEKKEEEEEEAKEKEKEIHEGEEESGVVSEEEDEVEAKKPETTDMYSTLSILDLRCSFVGDTWCYPSSILNVRDH